MHEGHRARMREKLLSAGAQGLHPHELLEMLLYSTNSRRDTNPLAHNLIESFGTFSGVFDASYEELMKVEGVGESTAMLIKLIPVISSEYLIDKNERCTYLTTSEEAYRFVFPRYINCTREMPGAVFLNNKGKALGFSAIGDGDVSFAEISSRRLIELCFKFNATGIIIFHNHPSGIALPSSSDAVATGELIPALKAVGVKLLDHIIIAGSDYVSMAQSDKYKMLFM